MHTFCTLEARKDISQGCQEKTWFAKKKQFLFPNFFTTLESSFYRVLHIFWNAYSRVSNKRAARFILFPKFLRGEKFSQAYIFGFCGLFHCHLIEMQCLWPLLSYLTLRFCLDLFLNNFRSPKFHKFGDFFQPARLFHPTRLLDTLEYVPRL